MSNIFIVGKTIYEIALENKFLPYVNKEIAARGWSDNTIITSKISRALNIKQKANADMLFEHG